MPRRILRGFFNGLRGLPATLAHRHAHLAGAEPEGPGRSRFGFISMGDSITVRQLAWEKLTLPIALWRRRQR